MKSLHPAGRLYAMQTGMKLDSKTPECRKFLVKLMDQLESVSGSRAQAVFLFHLHLLSVAEDLQMVCVDGSEACFRVFHFCPSGTVLMCVTQTLCVVRAGLAFAYTVSWWMLLVNRGQTNELLWSCYDGGGVSGSAGGHIMSQTPLSNQSPSEGSLVKASRDA